MDGARREKRYCGKAKKEQSFGVVHVLTILISLRAAASGRRRGRSMSIFIISGVDAQ